MRLGDEFPLKRLFWCQNAQNFGAVLKRAASLTACHRALSC
jgi:hypothetical protein